MNRPPVIPVVPPGIGNFRNLTKALGPPGDYGHSAAMQAGTILPISDPAEWTGVSGTTVVADAVNTKCNDGTLVQSVKFDAGPTNFRLAYRDFGVGNEVNFTNKILHVRAYIHPGSGLSDPNNLIVGRVYLTDSVAANVPKPHAGSGPDSKWLDLQPLSRNYKVFLREASKEGWHEWHLPVGSMSTGGTPNVTAIRGIYIYMIFDSGTTPQITIDRIAWYDSPLTTGMYAIRIDAPDSFTLAMYREIAGFAGSLGVPLSWGVRPRLMSAWAASGLDEMFFREMHKNGEEIAVYAGSVAGETIPNNWQDKTIAESVQQTVYSQAWFQDRSFAQGAPEILFVSGGSGWTPQDTRDMLPRYFATVSELRDYANPLNDPRFLYTSRFLDGEGPSIPADIAGRIAAAEADKTAFILGAHIQTANDRSALRAIMSALAASTLVGKTFSQLYKAE